MSILLRVKTSYVICLTNELILVINVFVNSLGLSANIGCYFFNFVSELDFNLRINLLIFEL